MALTDKLESTPRRTTGTPCSVGLLESYLSGVEAEAFDAMLHKLGWSGNRVWNAVQDEAKELRKAAAAKALEGDADEAELILLGADVHAAMSEQQVNRHRSRSCRCYR